MNKESSNQGAEIGFMSLKIGLELSASDLLLDEIRLYPGTLTTPKKGESRQRR
jgi:hypothetical protein